MAYVVEMFCTATKNLKTLKNLFSPGFYVVYSFINGDHVPNEVMNVENIPKSLEDL